MKARQATSILVLVFCLIASSAIGLFHDDDCLLGELNEDTTKGISSQESCPACMFSAGFKSIDADYGLPVLSVKIPIAFQSIQHFEVAHHHEWSYSILLRGPPLTSTS